RDQAGERPVLGIHLGGCLPSADETCALQTMAAGREGLQVRLFAVSAQVAQFGANLVRVGVMQVVQGCEGLLPGLASGVGIAEGGASLPEVGEPGGFAPAVAEFTQQGDRLAVAGDGLGMAAEAIE